MKYKKEVEIKSLLNQNLETKGKQRADNENLRRWSKLKKERNKEKEKGTALKNLESVLVQAADERHPCEVNLRSHTCIKKTTCQA